MSSNSNGSKWDNKLKSKDGKLPDPYEENLIKKFDRDDIFNSLIYTGPFLFKKLCLKNSKNKPSRPPNPFLITRAILVMEAVKNKTSIGDGTMTSILTSYIWGGADKHEKNRMKEISLEIKKIHKKTFPNYKYKPERNGVKDKFNNKTPKDFEADFGNDNEEMVINDPDPQYHDKDLGEGFEVHQVTQEQLPIFTTSVYYPQVAQYNLPFEFYPYSQIENDNNPYIINGFPPFT
ncbi:11204_t:CDS:1 [Diversispora eburnea]|uniref:11204_t:CDS:1 n=1 Tax=Diversispora eburnea TaxID=1213867 RepID=A0A9N8WJR6_9GLOM|nr:11204_t:CDS:1 [Diversispora eburnea]